MRIEKCGLADTVQGTAPWVASTGAMGEVERTQTPKPNAQTACETTVGSSSAHSVSPCSLLSHRAALGTTVRAIHCPLARALPGTSFRAIPGPLPDGCPGLAPCVVVLVLPGSLFCAVVGATTGPWANLLTGPSLPGCCSRFAGRAASGDQIGLLPAAQGGEAGADGGDEGVGVGVLAAENLEGADAVARAVLDFLHGLAEAPRNAGGVEDGGGAL